MRRLLLLLLPLCACQSSTPTTQRPPPPPSAPSTPSAPPPPPVTAPTEGTPAPTPAPSSRPFSRLGGALRPAWFICDGTSAPRIVVVERSADGKQATLTSLDKKPGATPVRQTYELGEPDAGMSQLFYPLLRDGKEVAGMNSVSPAVLPNPSRVWTPTFLSVRGPDGQSLSCRLLEGIRLLGFDGRRSVLITQSDRGLKYQTFDFADAGRAKDTPVEGYGHTTAPASQTVEGGTETRTPDGSTFTFQNNGYRYVLRAGPDASLEVFQAEDSVQRTDLLAWTYAPPPA